MACARCGCGVYRSEDIVTLNKMWHKCCFSCCRCNEKLDKCTAKVFQGEVFCQKCYRCILEEYEFASKPSSKPCRVVSSPSCCCIKDEDNAASCKPRKSELEYSKTCKICFPVEKSTSCVRQIKSCVCLPTTKRHCFSFPMPREVANYYNRGNMRRKNYQNPPNCCPKKPPYIRLRPLSPRCCRLPPNPRCPSPCIIPQCTAPNKPCPSPSPSPKCPPRCSRSRSPPCSCPRSRCRCSKSPCRCSKSPCRCSNKSPCRCSKPPPSCNCSNKCPPSECRCSKQPSPCPPAPARCRCSRSPPRRPVKCCCDSVPCCCPSPRQKPCCCCPRQPSCPPKNCSNSPCPRRSCSPCPVKNVYPTKKSRSPCRPKACCSPCPPRRCSSPPKRKNNCCCISCKPNYCGSAPTRDGIRGNCSCKCGEKGEKCEPAQHCVCGKPNPCDCKMGRVKAACTTCCVRCHQKVYLAEKITVSNGAYHTCCFSCYCCRKLLDLKNVHEHCNEIYCKKCYNHYFGFQYYGYGSSQPCS